LWGTVGGAWESGERAADAVLQKLGPLKPAAPAPAETEAAPKRKPTRARVERREPPTREASPQFGGTPSIMREETR
jgi:hypothetical protein